MVDGVPVAAPAAKAEVFRNYLASVMLCPALPDTPYHHRDDPDVFVERMVSLEDSFRTTFADPSLLPLPSLSSSPSSLPACPLMSSIPLSVLESTISGTKNKAPGLDKVATQSLKQLPAVALRFLLVIFNACLLHGHFPAPFKSSVITMIPKPSKDLSLPSSYRPISLLSTIGKIFERILASRLQHYVASRRLIPPDQNGFLPGRSSLNSLCRLATSLCSTNHYRDSALAVFLDVTKAFDTVCHEALVHKLFRVHHFPHSFVRLIRSFLTQRSCCVRVDSSVSSTFCPSAGVPQGAVLSPLLFLLYVSDLPSFLPGSVSASQFADDLAIWA